MLPTSQQQCALSEASNWPLRLAGTNINPKTFLATDYLNHFNEIIMLLEMLEEIPSCAADIAEWRPMSYVEHFEASALSDRDLAIAAYAAAPEEAREGLRLVVERLNADILIAAAEVAASAATAAAVDRPTLRRLVEIAGLVINGNLVIADAADLNARLSAAGGHMSQDNIDSLFK